LKWEVVRMLHEGDRAPDFTLPATGEKTISLADFKDEKNVVVYFYPKDFTAG
jgi:peroxiredoxin Q/BCP